MPLAPLGRLLQLPWQRYPVAMAVMSVIYLAAWSFPLWLGKSFAIYIALAGHAYASMFVGMFAAMVWTSVCRAETHLLPRFRRTLAEAWMLHGLLLVVLPAAAVQAVTGEHGLLVAAGLSLILATALASGNGMAWANLVWFLPMLFGFWPEVGKALWRALLDYPAGPLPILGVAGLIATAVWRRLMRVSDEAPTLSPADISATDLRHGPEAMRAAQMPAVARWLQALQHTLAAAAFDRVLVRLRRDPSAQAGKALERILLPNAHPLGLLIETAMTLVFGSLVLLLISAQPGRGGTLPVGMVGSYIGLLTALRFQQMHRAMLILRPSLADVYLALRPPSPEDFHRLVLIAMRAALGPALLFAATLAGLAAFWLYPEAQRWPVFVGGTAGGLVAALMGLGLAVHLLDSAKPRMIAGLVLLGLLGSLPAAMIVPTMAASWPAGAVFAAFWLTLAATFLFHAERTALRHGLPFDPAH
jgi:hypothetical protein